VSVAKTIHVEIVFTFDSLYAEIDAGLQFDIMGTGSDSTLRLCILHRCYPYPKTWTAGSRLKMFCYKVF